MYKDLVCEFPAQMASNAENVSIWWRHHDARLCRVVAMWKHSCAQGYHFSLRHQTLHAGYICLYTYTKRKYTNILEIDD